MVTMMSSFLQLFNLVVLIHLIVRLPTHLYFRLMSFYFKLELLLMNISLFVIEHFSSTPRNPKKGFIASWSKLKIKRLMNLFQAINYQMFG